jgi:hypothetical protein
MLYWLPKVEIIILIYKEKNVKKKILFYISLKFNAQSYQQLISI